MTFINDRLPIDRLAPDMPATGTSLTLRPAVLPDLTTHYRDRLLREQDLESLVQLTTAALRVQIERIVSEMMRQEGVVLTAVDKNQIITSIVNEAIGFGPLQKLMNDATITEIMVNGPNNIYVEQHGKLRRRQDVRFVDEKHVLDVIDRIVSPLNRRIDESSPMVDARLPSGSRVNAIIAPLSLNGPVLTIRRFRKDPYTMRDLIQNDTLTQEMAQFLEACVKTRLSILVSGGTGSGKTTTLNVLAGHIPDDERIIVIEDSAELQFHLMHPHVLRQESRPANVEGRGEVTIRQLVRNALRMRPNRIIVGEVRGAEALDMLQAMNTGHEGSMTTVHANSPLDAFRRLETMMMWAEGAKELPLSAIREQMASAIHIVVQQERLPDGSRRIVRISEVEGIKRGEILVKDIFVFEQAGINPETRRAEGGYTATGIRPRCLQRFKTAEIRLSHDIFEPAYLIAEVGITLLSDPDVSEIMVNGPSEVYIERKGHMERTAIKFRDEAHLLSVINTIVAPLGRRIDETSPMVDARLPDGSRVNALLPPIALNGPVLTIRRFPEEPIRVERLVNEFNTLTWNMMRFLQGCVRAKLNILISGGTGSGKTTTLNVLSAFVPVDQRIVTIEDVAELRLQQPHVVRQETRPADEFGEGAVTMRSLVINALRMRPDRIIVGEVRGAEALDMLQAMNTGHEGSLTTIHANSPADAFSRLETMVMWAGVQLPSRAIREQLVGALNIVVQQSRLTDGSRRVVAISEIQSVHDGEIDLKDIFVFKQTGVTPERQVIGYHSATGVTPLCLERLREHGEALEASLFVAPIVPGETL